MDLVSVIIPYFRKKKFIEKTINSIKSQTHKNLEIIIVYDDADHSDLKLINKIKSIIKKGKPDFDKIKMRKDEPMIIVPNINKAKMKEWEKPLCISVAEISSVKYLSNTSKSGIVPAIAPQRIALLPTFLPKTASPTDAPRTIWVNESNKY